jgi:PilZ domain
MDQKQRRMENRIPWRGTLQLIVPGSGPLEATIADISEFGCGLDVERAVEIGITAEIHGNGFEGAGIIRRCDPRNGRFRLGVELTPVS